MINAARVSKGIVNQLASDIELATAWPGIIIERSEFVNERPTRTPWIGVYRARKEYSPRQLGRHSASWQGRVTVRIMVQYASLLSGEDAEDHLEQLLEDVESAIHRDMTLNGTMEMVNGITVEYSYFTGDEVHNVYFQNATVIIIGEVRAGE